MPSITSATLACGSHAGDPAVMHATVALCLRHGVAIGGHTALPDLVGFGRRDMRISPDDAYAQPHGALYNMAARDHALAGAIAAAVRDFNPTLILVGLAGSALVEAGRAVGLAVQREGFCDRRYRADGTLTPRSQPHAVIEDIDAAVAQAVSIATHRRATADDGSQVPVEADTLCVHGDRANAAAFATRLRAALEAAGVRIAAAERPA